MQRRARAVAIALATMLGAALAGCSGGSGADVEEIPGQGGSGGGGNYNGPPPATADVQAFKIHFYDNVRPVNRCGGCHDVDVGQAPMFARGDDVNLAYAAANTVVDLTSPGDSLIVTKVASGHNCWLASDSACADILETWIRNWAGDQAVGGREIVLEPPPLRDPGQSKSFPADVSGFQTTVYPLLAEHCSSCHASNAKTPQSPFFAEGPATNPAAVQAAYESAKARIDLDDPARSRFVVRLGVEAHNCWTNNCAADADEMEAAIRAFANGIEPTPVDPSLLASKALTLHEGTIASGGNRYEAHVIALYEFKTGVGNIAFDTSGVEPAMDLTLSGAYEWYGGWGVSFSGGKAQATTAASRKLRDLIGATGEFSIEAWVAPANVVQEDARIVSYSAGPMLRNFNLGQTMYDYDFFVRSSFTDENGSPALSTPSAAEVLQATLQHVVATFDPVEGRKIYVNGVLVTGPDPVPPGLLGDWDDTYAFVLANEVSGNRPWAGVIRLVAIHNRALSEEQIVQNYEAGVGEKFFLLFGVEHLTNVPQSYVVVEAAQYDSYSYLFRRPFFISLDTTAQPQNLEIEGIRIGLNGSEAPVGQAFAKVDAVISTNTYDPATGQLLAELGTVVPLEKGPESDEFFLTFDAIGGHRYSRKPPPVPPAPAPADLPPASDIGVRIFDEINATMAAVTGVSPNDPNVRATFETVRESLPAVPTLEAVLASHQVAIAQLAIEYCNAMIENDTLRGTIFEDFDFGAPPGTAFQGASLDDLVDPLLARLYGGEQLATQPDYATIKTELHRMLYDPYEGRVGLATIDVEDEDEDDETNARTMTLAKAVCATVLGSAAMLVQ